MLRAEVAILDLAPLLACCNPDQGLIDRFLEEAAGRKRDRHIGGLENALGRPDRIFKARRDEILQGANAVDDSVGFSVAKGIQGGGKIIEGRVAQMAFIEILRPGRMSDRGELLAGQIGFRQSETPTMRSAVILDTIEVDRIETSATRASIQTTAMTRPAVVLGVLSPYPTVVIVTTAQ